MKYFKDFSGYLFLFLRIFRLRIYSMCSTIFSKIILQSKGVRFGSSNKFFGIPKVSRRPLSRIKLGSNNVFRSDVSSNLIGVNHKCILSTHGKNALIQIGDNCGFSGVTIGANEKIIIGDRVLCGANTVITDFDWHGERYKSESKPVIINDNVWLGLNTVVLKGVEIGKNSVIGANSIVIKSIPPNVIAAGNPCKILKNITENEE